jgi:hypothetical protein
MTTVLSKRGSGRARKAPQNSNRRTTLTLPEDLVRRAELLAEQRRQTLSATVADLMERSLRSFPARQSGNVDVLSHLRKAFAGFSEEEMLLLDGIVMEESPDSE